MAWTLFAPPRNSRSSAVPRPVYCAGGREGHLQTDSGSAAAGPQGMRTGQRHHSPVRGEPMSMRFRLPPGGDCPPIAAARRLWLTLEAFHDILPALQERGFPQADPTTGNFDLEAIDAWRRSRNP